MAIAKYPSVLKKFEYFYPFPINDTNFILYTYNMKPKYYTLSLQYLVYIEEIANDFIKASIS